MSGPRILIVDDEPFNVEYLEQELEGIDCQTVSAANGQEALDRIRTDPPDLILLDIMMPEMDGLEVARRLHNDERYKDQKIVILSALSDPDTQRKAQEAGVLEYWTKPISPDDLRDGMLRVLGTESIDLL